MSEENVEAVQAALAEFAKTRQLGNLAAPNVVWDMSAFTGWVGEREYHGADGFARFFSSWVEPYAEWDFSVEWVVDGGGDAVIAAINQRGRLPDSKSWVELRYGLLYKLASGRIARMQVHDTPEKALKAVGLSE
jgi:ketosteroid isomerase-like protein